MDLALDRTARISVASIVWRHPRPMEPWHSGAGGQLVERGLHQAAT